MFAAVVQAVNSVRSAVDAGQIKFYEPTFHQEVYQRAETKRQPQERRSQADVEQFLAEKAYMGFIAVGETTEVWAVDPWDAQYLGVTPRDLSLAMRVLKANGLLQSGTSPEYVRPTDKLLAERSSRTKRKLSPFPTTQQKLSHKSPPNKDGLLNEVQNILREYATTFTLVLVDIDNFKSVNDTNGHLAGDVCLDKVIGAIETVVGRKGKIYRWGGDEFAVCVRGAIPQSLESISKRRNFLRLSPFRGGSNSESVNREHKAPRNRMGVSKSCLNWKSRPNQQVQL